MQQEGAVAGHPSSVVNNSWDVAAERERGRENISTLRRVCAAMWHNIVTADSLSICLQLTDLKKDHEVIFGVTGTSCGASHRAELCRWH